MPNPHGLNDTQTTTPHQASSAAAADPTTPVSVGERRTVLLAAVQDRAAERNLLADAVGAALGPHDLRDPAAAAAIDTAMDRVAHAAQALRDARRDALEAAIPDNDIQAAYTAGSMGIRSTDNPAAIARLAVERDRTVFDTMARQADYERAMRTAEAERTQRIAASEQAEALRERVARLQHEGGADLDAIFDRWQADTAALVSHNFRSQPATPDANVVAGAGAGTASMLYTAAIEITQPGASAPVRLQSGSDLSSETQTADWVRDQLRRLGCDLAAHVRITAHASDAEHTVTLMDSAGYPHIVDEATDRWHRHVAGTHPLDTTRTSPPEPGTDPVAAPSAGQLLSASFEEAQAATWINDNGVVTAAPDQLAQTVATPAEAEPGQ
ncbi:MULTISPECIES: hypothetical protein [Nocardia]|nr:hypothetical protein [Nocardia africana]MCC3317970.1 hypothetical protein [Nocardia africana]